MRACLLLLVLLTTSCVTTELERTGPLAQESLLSFSGSLSDSRNDPDSGPTVKRSDLNLRMGYSYFVTELHEWGLRVGFERSDSNNPDDDSSRLSTSANYNLNFFQRNRTWFYTGFEIGLQYLSDDQLGNDLGILGSLHVGMRQWLNEWTAIFIEPFFTRVRYGDLDAGDTEFDRFGVSYGVEVTL